MQDKLSYLFIHKQTKQLVKLNLELINDEVKVSAHKSNNGVEPTSALEGSVMDLLPRSSGILLKDGLMLFKHFRANGYKEVSTVKETKDGLRFS